VVPFFTFYELQGIVLYIFHQLTTHTNPGIYCWF